METSWRGCGLRCTSSSSTGAVTGSFAVVGGCCGETGKIAEGEWLLYGAGSDPAFSQIQMVAYCLVFAVGPRTWSVDLAGPRWAGDQETPGMAWACRPWN